MLQQFTVENFLSFKDREVFKLSTYVTTIYRREFPLFQG